MSAGAWGYLLGSIGITIAVAYVILAVFLIKPLQKHRMVGLIIATAVTALFTFASASVAADAILNWLGWAIGMGLIAWRAKRSMQPRALSEASAGLRSEAARPTPGIIHSPTPNVPVDRPRNYFVRHWRGDLSLATSYWINGTLVATALPMILLGILSENVSWADSLRFNALAFVLAVTVGLLLWLWGIVGIWRSSDNHVARGGLQSYATLAKVMVVMGMLAMTGQLVTYVPALKDMTLIVLGNDPIGSYKATVLSDGKSILVKGMLREGSAKEIEKLMDSAPAVHTLVLSSNGGRLLEGKLLAMAVSKRALNTYVEDICVSTCTFVFLAGSERAATPNAKIGFHTPSMPGSDPEILRAGLQFMVDIYRQAGLPNQFLEKVRSTPATSMWFPTRDELIEARVITRMSLGGETTATFTSIRSKQELLLLMGGVPLFASFEKRFPDYIQKAADHAWTVKEQGGNDAQISNAIRAVTGEYYPRLIAQADDTSLESYTRLFVDQMKAARLVSYEACVKLMKSQLDVSTVLPKQYSDREQAWVMEALSSQNRSQDRRSKQAMESALQAVGSRMPAAMVDVIVHPTKYQDQPGLLCDGTIALYDAALSLPASQRAAALEGLLKGEV